MQDVGYFSRLGAPTTNQGGKAGPWSRSGGAALLPARQSPSVSCVRISAEIPAFAGSWIGREMQHGKRAAGKAGTASWRNWKDVDGSPASGSQSPSIRPSGDSVSSLLRLSLRTSKNPPRRARAGSRAGWAAVYEADCPYYKLRESNSGSSV
jgi:hypothetical protein